MLFPCVVLRTLHLVRYHRILDLQTFRGMVASGAIPADEIATVRSSAHENFFRHVLEEPDVLTSFLPYESAQVGKHALDFLPRSFACGQGRRGACTLRIIESILYLSCQRLGSSSRGVHYMQGVGDCRWCRVAGWCICVSVCLCVLYRLFSFVSAPRLEIK